MVKGMTQAEVDLEVRQMSEVHKWPYLLLPVKSITRQDSAGYGILGIILHRTPDDFDVFECNMWRAREVVTDPLSRGETPTCNVYHYNSFREIVEDGWIGD